MNKLKDLFVAAVGLSALVTVGAGFALAEKVTGRHIMGPKMGF